jgi:leader peptidase (prepilin peptidase) / N-methyltransferase
VSQVELAAARKPAGDEGRLLRSSASVSPFVLVVVALAFATLPLDRAVVAAFAGSTLVVLSAIDIERGIIPNRIVLPAAAIVLVAQVALFPGQASEWALAAVLAALALMIPQLLGRSWMGMGDVKLALLLGATLGWGVLGAVPIAFLCTFPVAVLVLLRGGLAARKTTIPFGPFLALGALIVLFGPHLSDLAS